DDQAIAAEAVRAAETALAAQEAEAAETAKTLARVEAERTAAGRSLREAEERLARIRRQHEQAARDHEAATAAAPDPAAVAELEQAVAAAETAVATAQAEADAAGRAIGGHRTAETAARDALQRAEGALTRKSAEEKAIAGVLAADAARDGQPVVDALDVEPGWEAALG